ncbi:MAG: hypothetical protein ACREL6_11945, partial [Gemmatimonadales bacterium]
GDGWGITRGNESWKLAGPVTASGPVEPILGGSPAPPVMTGVAHWVDDTPPLDGSMTGFDTGSPLTLDSEDQYRRSEEPWRGDEVLSATAWANWNESGLFVAVEVRKDDVWFRPRDAAPLNQDNELDDIHSDGLQLYLKAGQRRAAWVVVPDPDDMSLRVRATAADDGSSAIRGSWSHTGDGYRVTLGIFPEGDLLDSLNEIGFDLLINEMQPGRIRRAGQLVWSGGGGWVYLQGDRQSPDQLGVLELS